MAKQPQQTDQPESAQNRSAQPARPRRTRTRSAAQPADMPASDAAKRSESMASSPSDEDIRLRAYQRYLERGGGHGMDFEDWLEAERELKTRS